MPGLCILFEPEACIGCHGCEVACKNWRKVELGLKWRKVDTSWQGIYPDVKSVFSSTACKHCEKPECMLACPAEAITKEKLTGAVVVKQENCIGCRLCLEACPYEIPQFGSDQKMQKCDLCHIDLAGHQQEPDKNCYVPPCVATCPTHALRLVPVNMGHTLPSGDD
ncbi:MAG: 4Fe-4S binding protein [Peptococcaceae bacterium]|nr:4Fe-4S binding protein [Peptococcaceae bacterium]